MMSAIIAFLIIGERVRRRFSWEHESHAMSAQELADSPWLEVDDDGIATVRSG